MSQNEQGNNFEQTQLYIEIKRLLDGFKYKKTDIQNNVLEAESENSFDILSGYKTQYLVSHSPESRILESWYDYLGWVIVEAEPKNLKDSVKNTEAERRECMETLEFFMKRKPTGEDLKELLNLPEKYDEVVKNINKDYDFLMN